MEGHAHVWSTSNGKYNHANVIYNLYDNSDILSNTISRDGNRVVSARFDEVRLVQKEINTLSFWKLKYVGLHNSVIFATAIRGDGNQIVCILSDGSLHLWTYSNCEWKDRFIGRHHEKNTDIFK